MKYDINTKLIDMVLSVINVYGPLSKDEIINYIEKYHHYIFIDYEIDELNLYLHALVDAQRIYLINKKYSSLSTEILDVVKKELRQQIDTYKFSKKEYDKDELIKYANVDKLDGIKEFDDLKKYFYSLDFKKEVNKNELFLALCYGLYSCYDLTEVIDTIKNGTRGFNEEELIKYLKEYELMIPRPFLNGHTYRDINEDNKKTQKEFADLIQEKLFTNNLDEFFTENYKIKSKIDKKPYGEFSYLDCLELIKKVDKTEIFKLIDSDKLLELYINDEPVYVSILGYYGKDKNIVIYRSKEEMITSRTIMFSKENEFPDLPMHISCIEVSAKELDFLNDEMIQTLKDKKYPLEPNISVMEGYKPIHFPTKEETNLVGAVLSDIIKLVQLSNLSDISINLGETEEMFDIYQVYVEDDGVLYGKYNDIEIADIILRYDLDDVDMHLVKKLNKYKKHDIMIGAFIFNGYVKSINEYPHLFFIVDKENSLILDCICKSSNDISSIRNDVLKVLDKKKIKPNNIYMNNMFCYEIFGDYYEYFNLEIDKDNILNDIYCDFCKESDNDFDSIYSSNKA